MNCQFLNNHYLLISTTDGCVTIYDIATAKPVAKRKTPSKRCVAISIHQDYLITGGDDNAITVSQFDNTSIKLIDRVENAASATITSIGYVDDKSFITTSVDQIIRLWSFSLGKLVCHEARYTTIADTGCCDTTTVKQNTSSGWRRWYQYMGNLVLIIYLNFNKRKLNTVSLIVCSSSVMTLVRSCASFNSSIDIW